MLTKDFENFYAEDNIVRQRLLDYLSGKDIKLLFQN